VDPNELAAAGLNPLEQQEQEQQGGAALPPALAMGPGGLGGMSEEQLAQMQEMHMHMQHAASDGCVFVERG
jgi:hypothetical protein